MLSFGRTCASPLKRFFSVHIAEFHAGTTSVKLYSTKLMPKEQSEMITLILYKSNFRVQFTACIFNPTTAYIALIFARLNSHSAQYISIAFARNSAVPRPFLSIFFLNLSSPIYIKPRHFKISFVQL